MKKIIRLTEDDLHRIVKNVISEVMYNGHSYHGNNSYDWSRIADERDKKTDFYDKQFDFFNSHSDLPYHTEEDPSRFDKSTNPDALEALRRRNRSSLAHTRDEDNFIKTANDPAFNNDEGEDF